MRLRPAQGAPRSSWWLLICKALSLLVCLCTASSIVCHPSAHHAQTGYIYYQTRAFVPRSTPRRRGAVCLSSESPRDHFANLLPPAAKGTHCPGPCDPLLDKATPGEPCASSRCSTSWDAPAREPAPADGDAAALPTSCNTSDTLLRRSSGHVRGITAHSLRSETPRPT